MSNKTTDTSSLQTTKQMLDELDALMEKMLSLPVNDPDDAAPFPEAVVKPSLLPPTLSATLTLLQAPAPVQAEQTPTPHPAVNPPHFAPTMRLEAPPTVQERVPQLEPLTNEVMPPSMLDQLTPLLREIPVPSSASAMRWEYLPLMWINQEFDRATTLLGGSGAGLRSQAGRTLLGVSGVALMLVAVTWFLRDWFGWN